MDADAVDELVVVHLLRETGAVESSVAASRGRGMRTSALWAPPAQLPAQILRERRNICSRVEQWHDQKLSAVLSIVAATGAISSRWLRVALRRGMWLCRRWAVVPPLP